MEKSVSNRFGVVRGWQLASTVVARDTETRRRWNAGEIPLGLIQPESAGYGLNLQAGGHILVFFSQIWSQEMYTQTIDRLYRQGQEHPVVVYRIITEGTIDEDMVELLEVRENRQAQFLAALRRRIAA